MRGLSRKMSLDLSLLRVQIFEDLNLLSIQLRVQPMESSTY